MNVKLIATVAVAINLAACATVTKGTKNEVSITSTPSEASVVMTDVAGKYEGASCTTPCSANLTRKGSYKTVVSKEGYTPYEIVVVPKISGTGAAGMAGNVLIGGIIGAGVDAATGAMNDLSPNPLNVTLMPLGQESYRTDKKGNIVNVDGSVQSETTITEGEPIASIHVEDNKG